MKSKILAISIVLLGVFPSLFAFTEKEKAQIVEKVYEKMCAAKGSSAMMPKLIFNSTQAMQIAYMTKDKDGAPTIGFESKAFDVCAEMGPRMEDAISFLLGHELSHHFLNHHWGEDFRTSYSLGTLEKEIRTIDRAGVKKFETQADVQGGILCYLAGYGTSGIAEKLLSKLYSAYGIGVEASTKYPSLEERITIAKAQDSIVQTYIRIYETGNYSLLIGEYDLAISCFESIIYKDFHSASIYNNLGVAYFLSAVKMDDLNPLKYYYPIELDVLLAAKNAGSKGMVEKDPKSYYGKALELFKKAIAFDSKNYSAQLNSICAYSAMGNIRKAIFDLEDLENMEGIKENSSTYMNLLVLKGILMDQKGDKAAAIELLSSLEKQKVSLAKVNRELIENSDELADVREKISGTGWAQSTTFSSGSEKIHGVINYSLEEMNRLFPTVQTLEIAKGSEVFIGEEKDHRIYVFSTSNNSIIAFHSVLSNYNGKSARGLSLGSDIKDLEKEYGAPDNMLSSNAGTYYMYSKQNIIFLINSKGKLSSWILVKQIS